MLGDFSLGQKIILWVIPLLFAITVHETAHGWIASKLGDPTAKLLGRLTLNPLKHIDPIGTIIVPAILFSLGGFIFGWAKPVPITWQNLKNPRRDMALVAVAGPLANLLMAFLWVAIAKVAISFDNAPIIYMAQVGISINLVLMLLNLMPIPPLDGSRVVASFLSPKMAYQFNRLEVYGFLILVLLLASGVLGRILGPLLQSLLSVFLDFLAYNDYTAAMTENNLATTTTLADVPIATVRGQPWIQLPSDLYIPPQALEVLLEAFTGPLDLLLYLIKKQNFDILDIPVAEITRQYMQYIEFMQVLEIELAAEYLVMAAILTEIKSRLLLPKPVEMQTNDDEADPRAELIRRLQEYERTKQAAQALGELPRLGRDVFLAMAEAALPPASVENPRKAPRLGLEELVSAFQAVLTRVALKKHHAITEEPLSIKDRMSHILQRMTVQSHIKFTQLFKYEEGRMGVVVTFMALLELWRQSLIELSQAHPFGEIEVRGI